MISSDEAKEHIDSMIQHWRKIRDDEIRRKPKDAMFPAMESTMELKADCYIDAYQSMRVLLFKEVLQ